MCPFRKPSVTDDFAGALRCYLSLSSEVFSTRARFALAVDPRDEGKKEAKWALDLFIGAGAGAGAVS